MKFGEKFPQGNMSCDSCTFLIFKTNILVLELNFNYVSMTLQLEVERKDMNTRIGICRAAKPGLLLSSYGGRGL